MRRKMVAMLSGLLILLMLLPASVLAASDIELPYSGGTNITSVASENASLLNGLTKFAFDSANVTFSGNWLTAYYTTENNSYPVHYVTVEPETERKFTTNAPTWRYKGETYDAVLTLKTLYNTGFTKAKAFAVVGGTNRSQSAYMTYAGAIDGCIPIYKGITTESEQLVTGGQSGDGKHLFAEFSVKLVYTGTNTQAPIDLAYYYFSDIDARQSFKVEGINNLDTSNLFVLSKNAFNNNESKVYVKSGAIYATEGNTAESKNADAYVRVNNIQTNNTIIYGYGAGAGAGFGIYGKLYTYKFVSENTNYGTVSPAKTELFEGDYLQNSPSVSNKTGYTLKNWTVDKKVTLKDGTVIQAGGVITPAQMKLIAATQDLTFTAHFTTTVNYDSDANGKITDKTSETVNIGANPTGTTAQANTGYWFTDTYKVNKDVTLNDGTKIAAGGTLTSAQVKTAKITEPVTFTALNAPIVSYISDEHGTITGNTKENVAMNGHPGGTTETIEEDYWLSEVTCDKDVKLSDGTAVTAGTPIPADKLSSIVVTEPVTIKLIHSPIVTYKSDDHGTITGDKTENVITGENPKGTDEEPHDGYWFSHYVADTDVELSDGTVITAGEPLSPEEVQQAVVNGPVTFTAINEPKVYYKSDENGDITGIEEEDRMFGDNPTGTSEEPHDGYWFSHYVADTDVVLSDGTVITAGEPLSPEEVQQAVVNGPVTFTAINEPKVYYESDENGDITGIEEEDRMFGDNPAGTDEEPHDGYWTDHYTADTDVVLNDGSTITAGDPLTEEQVKQVKVTAPVTFTVHHAPVVRYESDENGDITGIEEEDRMFGDNPAGTSEEPHDGYWFSHYVADTDVELSDGTVITAGEPLSPEEVQQAVINGPVTFTAIHQPKVDYESDENGKITGITEEERNVGENPTGTEEEANDGYWTSHYTADVGAELSDGTVIPAGEWLTPEQVTEVVVKEHMTFTVHHAPVINYVSDENGSITGITEENMEMEANPTGTEEKPNEGYWFSHYVADKDVTLTDGTVIHAGEPLTPEQVRQVVATEPLTFTAIHAPIVTYVDDEHGTITPGRETENVNTNGNPEGTDETAEDGYWLSNVICDRDVILNDGTAYPAGTPIPADRLTEVVVTEPLTFDLNHAPIAKYTSDENGEITGVTEENTEMDSNPAGTKERPNEGYWFSHYVADKDVTLTDGTVIHAGEPLTPEQVKKIVITEPLTFTVIHAPIVSYKDGEHGRAEDPEEPVDQNGSPDGTGVKAADGYSFIGWICDKDVILKDGTVIPAGKLISPAQMKQVIVTEPLTFTAQYKKPATPATGDDGMLLPLLGAGLSALALAGTALFTRKRKAY